jgi:hypothetical protein
MLGALAALIPLATELLKMINSKQATKYLDEMTNIRKELLEETSKGFNSDDQKIVELYKRLEISAQAAYQEFQIVKAGTP